MTQQTQTCSEWRVTKDGVIVSGGGVTLTVPAHEFPALILNMVKVLRENTNAVD